VQLLERMSKNVVLALDADKAGIAAMKKGAELMLRRGLDVKVAKLPDGADPADMVLSDAKSFKTAIGHSVHVIEFLLIHLRQQVSDDRAYKLRVREEIVPFVTLIPNRIDQDHFEGIIATALGTNKEAVHFEVVRLLDIQKNNPVHREGLVSDVVIQKNEAGTSVKTLAYLVAAVNVVTPEERAVLKQLVIAIVGRPWSEACRLVPDGLSSQLTFSLETEFEKVSQKVRRAELVHKLNQLRELTLRDQMQVVRAQIGSSETGDGAILAEIAGLAKALQIPPLTTGVFDGG